MMGMKEKEINRNTSKSILMRRLMLLIVSFVLFLTVINSAYAGVGIVYGVRDVQVQEGETKCIEYGVYNPFSTDVTARIFASGEVAELIDREEQFFVAANTFNYQAKKVNFCFEVPKNVYESDCLAGNFFCNKECTGEVKVFSGAVVVQEVSKGEVGSGSKSVSSASANLNLIVACVPQRRNYFALSGLVVSIIVLAAVVLFIVWTRTPSYQRIKEIRYKKAIEKVQKMKKELKERAHHESKHEQKRTKRK